MAFMTGDTSGSMIVNMENIAPSSGNISPSQSADQVSFIVSGIPDEQDYSTLSENLSRSENTTGSIIELTENTPIIVPDITNCIEMP